MFLYCIADILQHGCLVKVRDGEYLSENLFQSLRLAAVGCEFGLQKLYIGIPLHLDEIRDINNLIDSGKVASLGGFAGQIHSFHLPVKLLTKERGALLPRLGLLVLKVTKREIT